MAQLLRKTPQEDNLHLTFKSPIAHRLQKNQSLAHNGVCLSTHTQTTDTHSVIAIAQTLQTTNISNLKIGDYVNIEPALPATGRWEGHYVQGHVDTILACLARTEQKGSWRFTFELPPKNKAQVIEKGAICLNGVSLTVHDLRKDRFSVSIIPYTYEHTTFSTLQVEDPVNVEFDILGKYIQHLFCLGQAQKS